MTYLRDLYTTEDTDTPRFWEGEDGEVFDRSKLKPEVTRLLRAFVGAFPARADEVLERLDDLDVYPVERGSIRVSIIPEDEGDGEIVLGFFPADALLAD